MRFIHKKFIITGMVLLSATALSTDAFASQGYVGQNSYGITYPIDQKTAEENRDTEKRIYKGYYDARVKYINKDLKNASDAEKVVLQEKLKTANEQYQDNLKKVEAQYQKTINSPSYEGSEEIKRKNAAAWDKYNELSNMAEQQQNGGNTGGGYTGGGTGGDTGGYDNSGGDTGGYDNSGGDTGGYDNTQPDPAQLTPEGKEAIILLNKSSQLVTAIESGDKQAILEAATNAGLVPSEINTAIGVLTNGAATLETLQNGDISDVAGLATQYGIIGSETSGLITGSVAIKDALDSGDYAGALQQMQGLAGSDIIPDGALQLAGAATVLQSDAFKNGSAVQKALILINLFNGGGGSSSGSSGSPASINDSYGAEKNLYGGSIANANKLASRPAGVTHAVDPDRKKIASFGGNAPLATPIQPAANLKIENHQATQGQVSKNLGSSGIDYNVVREGTLKIDADDIAKTMDSPFANLMISMMYNAPAVASVYDSAERYSSNRTNQQVGNLRHLEQKGGHAWTAVEEKARKYAISVNPDINSAEYNRARTQKMIQVSSIGKMGSEEMVGASGEALNMGELTQALGDKLRESGVNETLHELLLSQTQFATSDDDRETSLLALIPNERQCTATGSDGGNGCVGQDDAPMSSKPDISFKQLKNIAESMAHEAVLDASLYARALRLSVDEATAVEIIDEGRKDFEWVGSIYEPYDPIWGTLEPDLYQGCSSDVAYFNHKDMIETGMAALVYKAREAGEVTGVNAIAQYLDPFEEALLEIIAQDSRAYNMETGDNGLYRTNMHVDNQNLTSWRPASSHAPGILQPSVSGTHNPVSILGHVHSMVACQSATIDLKQYLLAARSKDGLLAKSMAKDRKRIAETVIKRVKKVLSTRLNASIARLNDLKNDQENAGVPDKFLNILNAQVESLNPSSGAVQNLAGR